jgi:hypothetical protein
MLRAPVIPVVQFLFSAAVTLAVGCAPERIALPAPGSAHLVFVGDAVLPRIAPEGGARADVGGISGAFYDARTRQIVAVSDDRTRPRLLLFDLRVATPVQVKTAATIALQPPHTERRTFDLEGIASARGGRVFVSSEGDAADPNQPAPGIYEYTRDGRFVRSLPLPRTYLGDGQASGMRGNGALEALSISPDGSRLFAAAESSLRQDGPEASFDDGATIRVLAYDLGAAPLRPREYAYRVEPLERPPDFQRARGDTGVSEIVALSATELLFLERGFVRETITSGTGRTSNTIRIFRAALADDAEVTGRESLAGRSPGAVLKKELVLDVGSIASQLSPPLRALENFEAMAIGPRLKDGRATLLLMSDDNFNVHQVTALVVLAFHR